MPFLRSAVLWSPLYFGANFGWPKNYLRGWVIPGFCEAGLGFLDLTKFLKNWECFLSVCCPSIPWAGNQSQSSCLAISQSGNSCLLATGFCLLTCQDNGMSFGQKSVIFLGSAAWKSSRARVLPQMNTLCLVVNAQIDTYSYRCPFQAF